MDRASLARLLEASETRAGAAAERVAKQRGVVSGLKPNHELPRIASAILVQLELSRRTLVQEYDRLKGQLDGCSR